MFTKLRNRLILSHVLPLLIILPLMGVALVYVLETQVILPSLSEELAGDAVILREVLKRQPEWVHDTALAQELLLGASPELTKRVILLSPEGVLLASSDLADRERLNQPLSLESLKEAPSKGVVVHTDFSQRLHGEVIDVLAPVPAEDGSLAGYVRITSRYATLADEVVQLRYAIGVILAVGLVVGAFLGSTLAVSISNPIQQVTSAVAAISQGERETSLPEAGPQEIRRLMQAVNALVERLRDLESSRKLLLSNVVHELGRPLGALRMAVQVLLQGSKEDPVQLNELLQGMDLELESLHRLLNDLTHVYEKDQGRLELNIGQVQLEQWLLAITRPWEEAARQKGLSWEVELPPALPPLRADPARLGQVIGNLLSNAIKFTPAGGKVTLSAGAEAGEIWLQVSDSGPGIAITEQEQVFTPFFRGRSPQGLHEGMGLGLSIARDIVQAQGGRLTLESQPGRGARFKVIFPRGSDRTD
ncbi:MAG: ATP-binding protein [Anaerolineales bacterium]|nr:ATP-binding protein [Anaerolineales bacterium]